MVTGRADAGSLIAATRLAIEFAKRVPRYDERHRVRPGVTGWAQINGLRGNAPIADRTTYDLYYLENWTLWLDLRILWMTVWHGIINRNAY